MELSFGNGALLLLLVAAMVAVATRRLKLPSRSHFGELENW
jgi:hypothetical protein